MEWIENCPTFYERQSSGMRKTVMAGSVLDFNGSWIYNDFFRRIFCFCPLSSPNISSLPTLISNFTYYFKSGLSPSFKKIEFMAKLNTTKEYIPTFKKFCTQLHDHHRVTNIRKTSRMLPSIHLSVFKRKPWIVATYTTSKIRGLYSYSHIILLIKFMVWNKKLCGHPIIL